MIDIMPVPAPETSWPNKICTVLALALEYRNINPAPTSFDVMPSMITHLYVVVNLTRKAARSPMTAIATVCAAVMFVAALEDSLLTIMRNEKKYGAHM